MWRLTIKKILTKGKTIYKSYRQPVLVGTIVILLLIILTLLLGRNSNSADNQQLKAVVAKVSKLMILPKNEQPTLATVTDKSKLKDQFLAENSQNGDRVLIYAKNHMVIIYRPGINKIAAVGTVSGDPAYTQSQGSSLTVLDSINNPEKKQKIIDEVKKAYPSIKITDGGSSNRKDFPYTIVIDNTNQKDELRDALIKDVSGKRGFLPPSESTPSTEFLIIVGQD